MTYPPRSALVLQGGGALGAFELGAARALYEQNIRPDLIAGVSIGAAAYLLVNCSITINLRSHLTLRIKYPKFSLSMAPRQHGRNSRPMKTASAPFQRTVASGRNSFFS